MYRRWFLCAEALQLLLQNVVVSHLPTDLLGFDRGIRDGLKALR